MSSMNWSLVLEKDFSEFPFINKMDRQLSDDAKAIIRESFICEASWANRVLKSAPNSHERSELMKMMYDDIHKWSPRITKALGQKPYYSDPTPNQKAAASIKRLLPKGGRCLEVGCGGGSLTWGLALQGWDVCAIDLVEEIGWSTIEKQTMGRARFQVADITITDGETLGSDHDLIIMEECLEHIPPGDYEEVLSKAFTLLRRGGGIIIVIPNAIVGPSDISKYFVRRGGKALGEHFNERSVRNQARDLSLAGFAKIVSVPYGGLASGRRFGWNRFWYFKALGCEALFSFLPPQWRWRRVFPYLVPPAIAAFKP